MEKDLELRSKNFAHRCVKLAVSLPKSKLGSHIEGQLIRCATSVGQSKKSFIAKLSKVIEEINESNFWIEFLIDEELLSKEKCESLLKESAELTSIFIAYR